MLRNLVNRNSAIGSLVKRLAAGSRIKARVFDLLLDPKEIYVLDLVNIGYLVDTGWLATVDKQVPVDRNNEPIPWITYPALDFLAPRLKSSMDIFEFGAGNSTLYYAARTASVTSVEHDAGWYEKISGDLPQNVTMFFKELEYGGEYCRTAMATGKAYDIIIVDGRDRVNCMKNSLSALKNDGIVVLDDSQRDNYCEGIDYISNKGFKRIDFWGITPGNLLKSCTTVFYKAENCVDL